MKADLRKDVEECLHGSRVDSVGRGEQNHVPEVKELGTKEYDELRVCHACKLDTGGKGKRHSCPVYIYIIEVMLAYAPM